MGDSYSGSTSGSEPENGGSIPLSPAKRFDMVSPIQISGTTVDGKDVIAGVFYLTSTIGLPLSFCIDLIYKRGMVVDWMDFYRQSIKEGEKHSRIIDKIKGALQDSCDKKTESEVMKRLLLCTSPAAT